MLKCHTRKACSNNYKENRTSVKLKNAKDVRKVSKEESSSEDDISDRECEVGYLKINSIRSEKSKLNMIELKINNKIAEMELDTGSEISVLSKCEFERCFGRKKLNSTTVMLRTFSGEKIGREEHSRERYETF